MLLFKSSTKEAPVVPRYCRFLSFLVALLAGSPATADPKAEPSAELTPTLKPLWKVTTIGRPHHEYIQIDEAEIKNGGVLGKIAQEKKERITGSIERVKRLYTTATEERKAIGRPLIPPFIPAASDGLVIYHDNCGIVARAAEPLERFGSVFKPGELYWELELDFSILSILKANDYRTHLSQSYAELGKAASSEFLWSRTGPHALSVHDGRIHRMQDFPVPPPKPATGTLPKQNWYSRLVSGTLPNQDWYSRLISSSAGTLGHELSSIDLASGKQDISLGSVKKGELTFRILANPYHGPHGLTVVWERSDRSLRLARINLNRYSKEPIDYSKPFSPEGHQQALERSLLWETELVTAPESVATDFPRRIHSLHLTESSDLIITPTHLGRVIAVESKTGKTKWAHEYAPLTAKRFPHFAPEWIVVPPAISDGKYVYAPADFPTLLCLNVADGAKVWSVNKEDGLYPVVVKDKVLVIGEKVIRTLSMKDGAELQRSDLPGLPCGRGAFLGNDYLLPVSEPKTWKGMIAIIDATTGKVRKVLKPEKEEPIGNLVVYKDLLISQSFTELAVFPIHRQKASDR